MQRGALLCRDKVLKRFVHVSCARVQQAVVDRIKDTVAQPSSIKDTVAQPSGAQSTRTPDPTLPHGLALNTLDDYSTEWSRYLQFASSRHTRVPGRDVAWDMQLLWDYVQHRAHTCKPETVKQILTKLAHFGARHNFVLATSKFDGDPAAHRIITKMKKQLVIDARADAVAAGVVYAPVDRCTPVARPGVSMLLSAFRLSSEPRFNQLSRKDRHHVAGMVMQHTGGMRFGHFPDREYRMESFHVDAADGSMRLVTDWSRYAGRRQFCIEFPASPRFAAMWYEVYAANGDVIDTYAAATLLHWHFARLRRDGESRVFAPVRGETCSREQRQAWLREVLLAALPSNERYARASVDAVTPHSFRPGLAGDLHREGVALARIGSICRWNTQRVVRLYAERPSLSVLRITKVFRFIDRF